jgi:hypothetical protein
MVAHLRVTLLTASGPGAYPARLRWAPGKHTRPVSNHQRGRPPAGRRRYPGAGRCGGGAYLGTVK